MRLADAAVERFVTSEVWTMQLRRGDTIVAEAPAVFARTDDGWTAEAVFGPFPRRTAWSAVALCSSVSEDVDFDDALLGAGRLYRHTVTVGAE